MTKTQEAALARLKKAVEGQPLESYCQYQAGDVTAVGELVPAEKRDADIETLVNSVAKLRPNQECFSYTFAVAHLLETVAG